MTWYMRQPGRLIRQERRLSKSIDILGQHRLIQGKRILGQLAGIGGGVHEIRVVQRRTGNIKSGAAVVKIVGSRIGCSLVFFLLEL